MRKRWLSLASVLAILGIVVSIISLWEYFHIFKTGLEEASFCAINEVINCDIVNTSSYATLFSIPTAAWGLFFYITVFAMALFARMSRAEKDVTVSFVWAFAFVAFLWTLRMAYVSAFILHAVCITCMVQYVLNILLLTALFLSSKMSFFERVKTILSKKVVSNVITTAIIFGIGYVFTLSAVRANGPLASDEDISELIGAHYKQSLYDIKKDDILESPVWGNLDAPVTIVEFSDFQCPFCRVAAFNIKPYLHEFRDKVKFVFMNYPLDNSCNQYMKIQMHQNACIAAEAVVCAQKNGKFWGYHEDVFRNNQKISRDLLIDLAQKHGMDKNSFASCLDSPETVVQVKKDIELGHHIYLTGTPSIFINQRQFHAWRSPSALRAVINEEIKRLKKGTH